MKISTSGSLLNETDLLSDLEQIKRSKRIPALAAAAYINGELREIAAIGKRKVGGNEPVTINDKWHIGSCTKPMTSTLAGILIEQGQVDWTTTIADIFEDWRDEMHSGWQKVTLEQLLVHHGGAADTVAPWLWQRVWEQQTQTPTQQRIAFVHDLLLMAPLSVPGSKFLYSNSGYAIAGLMLETCTKRDWESLITETLFKPLGMVSAGFGAPGTAKIIDQPYGHARRNGKLSAIEPGPFADNPAAIGPAGTVHCSIEDLLKFATSHAGAGAGAPVGDNILQRLHRRYGASEYSAGWNVVQRDWGGGYVLSHDGSNTYWFASMWIAPFRNAAFVAACNAPAPAGQQACHQAINQMIERQMKAQHELRL